MESRSLGHGYGIISDTDRFNGGSVLVQGGGLEETYHANFIINMLLRYPEIYTASFDLATSSYNVAYLIAMELKGESYRRLCTLLKDNLEAFSCFQKREVHRVNIRKRN